MTTLIGLLSPLVAALVMAAAAFGWTPVIQHVLAMLGLAS